MVNRPPLLRALAPALILTALLLAARIWSIPTLADPTGAPLPDGLRLHTPPLYFLLTPLFSIWDGVSLLSMDRLKGFLWGMGLLYLVWRIVRPRQPAGSPLRVLGREALAFVLSLLGFVLFVGAGILWHRPMLALTGADPGQMVVDLHSHSNVSHDVKGTLMKGFDVEASRRWHGRAGFDAFFVTDHNTTAGWRAAPVAAAGLPSACPGIEVSAWRAHIVLLGDTTDVRQQEYDGSLNKVLSLLRDSRSRYGALAIASLPEYSRSLWPDLDSLVAAGVAGFEIVNASPKAADFPIERRDSIIRLARSHGLLLAGVSDAHGWGATSLDWMLVPVTGWRDLPNPCPALLDRLGHPDDAIRIVERHHLIPESRWPRLLTPIGVVWEEWRSLDLFRLLGWLAWIWGVALVGLRRRGLLARSDHSTAD
ncbi:MAG TPA: hypothetical protein VMJ30_07020 [Gemmatimonadales bacterium]|nr:hypothetical protein [Gemmatimonadales bacterium]